MSNNTVIITEADGAYRLENNGISEFALIGILECVLFDLKSADRAEIQTEPKSSAAAPQTEISREPTETEKKTEKEIVQETEKEAAKSSPAPELRTRIGNAVKAIKSLGGDAAEGDLSRLTDEELQAELESLTNQYKRLKSSKTETK